MYPHNNLRLLSGSIRASDWNKPTLNTCHHRSTESRSHPGKGRTQARQRGTLHGHRGFGVKRYQGGWGWPKKALEVGVGPGLETECVDWLSGQSISPCPQHFMEMEESFCPGIDSTCGLLEAHQPIRAFDSINIHHITTENQDNKEKRKQKQASHILYLVPFGLFLSSLFHMYIISHDYYSAGHAGMGVALVTFHDI